MADPAPVLLALVTAPANPQKQIGEVKQENPEVELLTKGQAALTGPQLPDGQQVVDLVRSLASSRSEKCLATARLLMGKYNNIFWDQTLQTKLTAHPTIAKASSARKAYDAVKVGDFRHLWEGATNNIETFPPIRPEFATERAFNTPNIFTSTESHGRVDGRISDRIRINYSISWVEASSGGQVTFQTGQKSSLLLNSNPTLIAYSSGPYNSGSFPDGLTVAHGVDINTATSFSMGGVAILKRDGQVELHPIDQTPWGDLRTPDGAVRFKRFYTSEAASVFQSHLIIHNGQSMVDPKATNVKSWERSMRRVLAVFKEGSTVRYAIIDFNDRITLPEAALYLKKLPCLVSAINLDTGINNCRASISPGGSGLETQGCRKGGPVNPVILSL